MNQLAPGNQPESSNFHAGLLLQLVEDLQVRFGHERSCRLCPNFLLPNRILLTLKKEDIPQRPEETILSLCRGIHMPGPLLEVTKGNLPEAKFIHFGFEENEASCLYKVYLEFGFDAKNPGSTVLLHRAFKWDIADTARYVQTEYWWYPSLTIAQIERRLIDVYRTSSDMRSLDLARGILGLAAARAGHEVSYLEVNEQANQRHSFDLNIYDAGLFVRDLEPFFTRMANYFAVSAQDFQSLYESIKDKRFGHLAGGVHRNGQDFFNLYFGMEWRHGKNRSVRVGWVPHPLPSPENKSSGQQANHERLQFTTDQDQYFNYCWWPYLPVAPTQNKYRPISLLYHSFAVAGLEERAFQLVRTIQEAIGQFRTVWGTKWIGNRLAWEFYFYDYQRRQRQVSISRVLQAIRPLIRCDVPVNEGLPYFMFSLDIPSSTSASSGDGSQELEVVHMYIGNPGSKVSSGIAYALTAADTTLENFYFFFDARRDLRAAAEKIYCSAHVDAAKIDIDRLLRPELRNCHTICVANKQKNDTVYFSGVNVDQLLFFLNWLQYPPALIAFVERNRDKLDHLLFDVGFDYIARGQELQVVKSGYYGVF